MRKSDTRKAELMSLITRTEDAGQIKSIAKLLGKMDEVMIEEAKLSVVKERIDRLNHEISTELKSHQAAVGEKPKSTRGRKKKVA